MLKHTLFAAATLFVAGTASAQPLDRPLPVINDVALEVGGECSGGPGVMCPAVEPWTNVSFTFVSCSPQQFEADVKIVGNTRLISVERTRFADCRGPERSFEYTIQVDSVHQYDAAYVLLNPLGIKPGAFFPVPVPANGN